MSLRFFGRVMLTVSVAVVSVLLGFYVSLRNQSGNVEPVPEFYGSFFDEQWGKLLYEVPSDSGWLSLGMWPAPDYGTACQQLLDAMISKAKLEDTASTALLEVGFGQAVSTFAIARKYPQIEITAVDLTPQHVEAANAKKQSGQRVSFMLGSATELAMVLSGSQDVIVALECAFHFDTREDFLREAMRVLKPGGRVVLADVILPHASKVLEDATIWIPPVRRFVGALTTSLGVPLANHVHAAGYHALLSRLGFAAASVVDISDSVSSMFWKHASARLQKRRDLLSPSFARYMDHMGWYLMPVFSKYVLVSAAKPEL